MRENRHLPDNLTVMDEVKGRSEGLPAVIEPADRGFVVRDDMERLRREVAPPAVVRAAGPNAEYAYADFFKARVSNANTRKAYKRAVDRFLGWCRLRGLELRQVTSFLVGDYLEHRDDSTRRDLEWVEQLITSETREAASGIVESTNQGAAAS